MQVDAAALDEIVASTESFVRDHLAALARWPSVEPERAADVAASLRDGLDGTLRANVRAVHEALGAPQAAARGDVPAALAEARRALAGEPGARLAAARGALEKRLDEVTGTLFAYRQTLLGARFAPEDAALTALAFDRVRAAHARASSGAALALDALKAWAREAARAAGAPAPPTASAARPEDNLAAARAALAAGAPAAAVAALARALEGALVARLAGPGAPLPGMARALEAWAAAGARWPAPRDDLVALAEALADARGADDALVAWRLLDAVEPVVHAAGMTGVDDAARARAARALG